MKATTVIVDDEELARRLLREYLVPHGEVSVIAECVNGFDAVKTVTELHPDILFLDIQMPRFDGFEVLELLPYRPAVIFTTAFDAYAVRAFEVHALDYLLKPFSRERCSEALARALAATGPAPDVAPRELARAAGRRNVPIARILVRDGATVHILPAEAVEYIEAQDDYVCIHAGKRKHLKQQTLSDLESELDPARFLRVHRSFLLNIDHLLRVEPFTGDRRSATLRDGTRLPVSRAGYARLRRLFGERRSTFGDPS